MSLNYSNQETSVTIGESVRDEDGMLSHFLFRIHPNYSHLAQHIIANGEAWTDQCLQYSFFNQPSQAT
jgi:hypothetical protein